MFEKRRFKAKLVEMGFSVESIAGRIGINPATMFRKMNGDSDFTRLELQNLRTLLQLTPEEFDAIFFADELTETQVATQTESGCTAC